MDNSDIFVTGSQVHKISYQRKRGTIYAKYLYRGQEYETARPVIHIGILNFVLFPDAPEFYASYQMLNVKNHYLFNDKFMLNVLSLKETELATEEDKLWKIDKWAELFATKTWRDIKLYFLYMK